MLQVGDIMVSGGVRLYYSNIQKKEFKANADVLVRFAKAFSENIIMRKTHLHLASRINWDLFEKYLSWLTSNNYIESKMYKKEKWYQLTEKGREMFMLLLKFHMSIGPTT